MWFSNHLAGTLIYIPAAVAGALLPFRLAHKKGISVSSQVAGSCLFHAILAVILTVVGGKVAYSHFCWAAAAYISLWIVPKVRVRASNDVLQPLCMCSCAESMLQWYPQAAADLLCSANKLCKVTLPCTCYKKLQAPAKRLLPLTAMLLDTAVSAGHTCCAPCPSLS